MTGSLVYHTTRGVITYTPTAPSEKPSPPRLPDPPCRPRQRRPQSIHITRWPAGYIPSDLRPLPLSRKPKKPSWIHIRLGKLASRENAKRVLGSVFSPQSSSSASAASSSAANPTRSGSPSARPPSFIAASTDPNSIYSRRTGLGTAGLAETAMSRSSLDSFSSAQRTNTSAISINSVKSVPEQEKPVASKDGVSCYFVLAEPVIFLTGLDHDGTTRDSSTSPSAMLRGSLLLSVTKSAKIKKVTVTFSGTARTEWPEGIPPAKVEKYEEEKLRTHVLPYFNAMFEGSDRNYGDQCNYTLRDKSTLSSVTNLSSTTLDRPSSPGFSLPGISNRSSRSGTMLSAKDIKRLSLQSNQSRSFSKDESPCGPTPQQKGYKVFHPGVYEYPFELPIDNNSPETTKLNLASVIWQLEVEVERAGTFRSNLHGFKEIPVVRSPSEDSLELVEPIAISRNWEDQLHYEIMISGKSFPLGSKIPIAFKLTPLAKVQVHKIKVYVSENIEYFTNNKKVTRKDVTRKILLMEKIAGKPLAKAYASSEVIIHRGGETSPEERMRYRRNAETRRLNYNDHTPLPDPVDNILGDIDLGLDHLVGATELEMNVQLPTCEMMEKDRTMRLTHDCTWKNVNVHHWIKLVIRISRKDTESEDPNKRRHFEISIDSPFTILNCRATRDNLALPEYSGVNSGAVGRQHVCGCPNAATSSSTPASSPDEDFNGVGSSAEMPEMFIQPSLARPPQVHLSTNAAAGVQRPIHLIRSPSFTPPPFYAEEPPPPLITPPPLYDQIIGTPSHDGWADYFARLSEAHEDDDATDDEDMTRASSRGRVNVPNPRTPGGRVARSMDIDRNFMFNRANFNHTLSHAADSGTGTGT